MRLKIKTDENNTTIVQIKSFCGKGGVTEHQLLISVTDPFLSFRTQLENIQKMYIKVLNEELTGDAVAVFRRYYLSDAANQSALVMKQERDNAFCPLSVIQQAPLNGTKIATCTYLQTGMDMQTCSRGGCEFSHNGYRHYWNGNASTKATNSESQTRLVLDNYISQLTGRHMTLATDCIRTWFFVQNVDVNYSGVVKARKEIFSTQGLTENTHYIASTGIEGRHADPAILVQMDSYAVGGLQPEQIRFLYAPTHLNPTYEYGVTFERGTAVTYGDRKQIFISGTASIDNRGEILHPGDIIRQTGRMMENIRVLLEEAGAGTDDIMQAIVYLRDPADYLQVQQFLETNFPSLPHLIVLAPVCRPGWLVEMECMAVIPADEPRFMCL